MEVGIILGITVGTIRGTIVGMIPGITEVGMVDIILDTMAAGMADVHTIMAAGMAADIIITAEIIITGVIESIIATVAKVIMQMVGILLVQAVILCEKIPQTPIIVVVLLLDILQEAVEVQTAVKISQRPVREVLTEVNRLTIPLDRHLQEMDPSPTTITRPRLVKVAVEPLVPKREHAQQRLLFQQIIVVLAAAVLPATLILLLVPAVRLPVAVVTVAAVRLLVPLRHRQVVAVIHREAVVEVVPAAEVIHPVAVAVVVAGAPHPVVEAEGKNVINIL